MTRVVLVTGANRGVGQELARQLALRGDVVVLTARDLGKAERTAAALPGHERVLARRLDVTDPASIQRVAADLDRRYGRLDVLVNNAAIHYDTWQQASTADLQTVKEALEINLLGAWQTSLTLLPLLHRDPDRGARRAASLPWRGEGDPAVGWPAGHRSRAMQAFVASQRRWLVVERLPAYAPELNPVEALWANLKGKGGELATSPATPSTRLPWLPLGAPTGYGNPRTCRTGSFAAAACPCGEQRRT
jgi:NAD(P)-dependent dehydrogenase (short-subunit alcohol dehydrogenase family)